MLATAYLVGEIALRKRVRQLPGVNQILQVVTDVFGRVVQDGADEVVVIIVIITGVGITEGRGPLTGRTALDRGSLGTALLLLHAEHQVILHDVCCCVDKDSLELICGSHVGMCS